MAVFLIPVQLRLLEAAVTSYTAPIFGRGISGDLDAALLVGTLSFLGGISVPRSQRGFVAIFSTAAAVLSALLIPWILRRVYGHLARWLVLALALGPPWVLAGLQRPRKSINLLGMALYRAMDHIFDVPMPSWSAMRSRGLGALLQMRLWTAGIVFVSSRNGRWAAAAILLASMLSPGPAIPDFVLESRETEHGFLSVARPPGLGVTVLRLDHAILGARFVDSGDSAFGSFYFPSFARFSQGVRERTSKSALILGLGIGVDASELLQAGWNVTAVELIDEVGMVAKKHFGLPDIPVHREDTWTFLAETSPASEPKFDVAILDIFAGSPTTESDFSADRLQNLRASLKPGGIAVINIVARPRTAGNIHQHLLAVFPHIRLFCESIHPDAATRGIPEGFSGKTTNLVFYLADQPFEFFLPRPTRSDYELHPIRSEMMELFGDMEVDPRDPAYGAKWDLEEARIVARQHREAMDAMFDRKFWSAY